MTRTYGHVKLEDGYWRIKAEPHIQLRLKRIFGKINKNHHGVLSLSNTAENCRDLVWFRDRYPLDIAPADVALLEAQAREHRDLILRLERIIDPNYLPRRYTLTLPARTYQSREAEIYLANRFLLIADDVGLGKTASAICSFTDPRTLPAIVVTLTHLPWQWIDEIHKLTKSRNSATRDRSSTLRRRWSRGAGSTDLACRRLPSTTMAARSTTF